MVPHKKKSVKEGRLTRTRVGQRGESTTVGKRAEEGRKEAKGGRGRRGSAAQ